MAWSNSKVFRAFVQTCISVPAEALDLDADTFKAALYDNDITPSSDVTQANSCYNADQWVTTGNEVFDGAEWPQGGQTMGTLAINVATTLRLRWTAANTASGSSATLAAVFGALVYDDTSTSPNDQGVCYNYFGGTNSVTDGTFTIVWNSTSGVMEFQF